MNAQELLTLTQATLDEAKAQAIAVFDVKTLTDVCDFIVICTATSKRHAGSIADKLSVAVKEQGVQPLGTESDEEGAWTLVDLSQIIVHIMLPEARSFYNLEQLWGLTSYTRDPNAD